MNVRNNPSILVISTFAEDVIYNSNALDQPTIKAGGPALWISQTLKDLGASFELMTPKNKVQVEIVVNERHEESGKILTSADAISIKEKIERENIIISAIGDEFLLKDLDFFEGAIFLDIQGHARFAKKRNELVSLPVGLAKKITVLKATEQELQCIDPLLLQDQKSRTLVITKGSRGVELIVNNKTSHFMTRKISPQNTIGAGDVFLASLVSYYSTHKSFEDAVRFAMDYTTTFLLHK